MYASVEKPGSNYLNYDMVTKTSVIIGDNQFGKDLSICTATVPCYHCDRIIHTFMSSVHEAL